MGVRPETFDFRKKGKTRKTLVDYDSNPDSNVPSVFELTNQLGDIQCDNDDGNKNPIEKNKFQVKNLIKKGVHLDHKKILEETAKRLDMFRLEFDHQDLSSCNRNLADLKKSFREKHQLKL